MFGIFVYSLRHKRNISSKLDGLHKMTNISHQCDQLRNDENTFIKCQYDILKIKKSLI